jgi:hypothetical protein
VDEPTRFSEAKDTGLRPGPPGIPRWVKVFLIVLILLVVALIVSLIAGVEHGPRLH